MVPLWNRSKWIPCCAAKWKVWFLPHKVRGLARPGQTAVGSGTHDRSRHAMPKSNAFNQFKPLAPKHHIRRIASDRSEKPDMFLAPIGQRQIPSPSSNAKAASTSLKRRFVSSMVLITALGAPLPFKTNASSPTCDDSRSWFAAQQVARFRPMRTSSRSWSATRGLSPNENSSWELQSIRLLPSLSIDQCKLGAPNQLQDRQAIYPARGVGAARRRPRRWFAQIAALKPPPSPPARSFRGGSSAC